MVVGYWPEHDPAKCVTTEQEAVEFCLSQLYRDKGCGDDNWNPAKLVTTEQAANKEATALYWNRNTEMEDR